jgi:hypothetical protein
MPEDIRHYISTRRQTPQQHLGYDRTISYQVLPNLSFTNHRIILQTLIASVNKQVNNVAYSAVTLKLQIQADEALKTQFFNIQ